MPASKPKPTGKKQPVDRDASPRRSARLFSPQAAVPPTKTASPKPKKAPTKAKGAKAVPSNKKAIPGKAVQMGKTQPKASTISEYISQIPEGHQEALQTLRKHIQSQIPDSIETISYGLPTFKYQGKPVIHFGAFKSHIGLYPAGVGSELFAAAGFGVGKGSVRIPFSKPLPIDLIDKTLASNKSRIEAQLGKKKK